MTIPLIGGRPKAFNSPEDLAERIQAFYDHCESKDKPLTLSRLASHMGVNRQTVWNYQKVPEYRALLDAVKIDIEADMEERLQAGKGSAAGVIFSLKNNYGWKDATEVNQNITGEVGVRKVTINGVKPDDGVKPTDA